jgi:hypothetical protein
VQLKRKIGVRGTGGSTPAQPSKIAHRREASTPALLSRPPSVISDSGSSVKDRVKGTETPLGISKVPTAFGKSVRTNVGAQTQAQGSMGPPPPKPRASGVGTPTPASRGLARSTSARPTGTPVGAGPHHRSVSSGEGLARMKVPRVAVPVAEEKENVDAKRPVMVPA